MSFSPYFQKLREITLQEIIEKRPDLPRDFGGFKYRHWRDVSILIEAKTNITFSPKSLKNWFREKAPLNYPQPSNLNTLCKFLGYADWEDFVHKHPIGKEEMEPEIRAGKKSIVVLPFKNISPDPDNEYFSDGLTEEIIIDLSQLEALRVISVKSAMTLKGTQKSLDTIGRDWKVNYALLGSVRKAGNKIRISAQLIEIATEKHLCSNKYTGTLEDIFDIQESFSQSVVKALNVKLDVKETAQLKTHPIPNIMAYDYYLRARKSVISFEKSELDKAIILLEKGLDIIGPNEVIYAGIGLIHFQYYNTGLQPEPAVLDKVLTYVEKILNLNPASHHALLLRGLVAIHHHDLATAIRSFKKANRKNPHDTDLLFWMTLVYSMLGQTQACLKLLKQWKLIEPTNEIIVAVAGMTYLFEGRYEKAAYHFRSFFRSNKDKVFICVMMAIYMADAGYEDEALEMLDYTDSANQPNPLTGMGQMLRHAINGNLPEGLACVTPAMKTAYRFDLQYTQMMGAVYSRLGAKKEALEWIRLSIDKGVLNYLYLSRYSHLLKNLSQEPEYHQLMDKVKKGWQVFKD